MATPTLQIEDRIRRSKGRSSRNRMANARVTQEEQVELERAAQNEGKALSEWAREVLLREARGRVTDRAMFTEVIALRQLLTSTLRFVATGKAMTEAQYDQVTTELRSKKHSTALEVLEQYAALGGKR